MTLRPVSRVLLVLILAGVGACENTPTRGGVPWWPQGPGNPPGSEQQQATSDQAKPSPQPAQTAATAPATAPSAARAVASPPPARTDSAPTSDAQATRYGDLLFISGQSAADGGDIARQTHAVMQKIGAILDSHRLTMANIVQVTVQLASIEDLPAMDAAYASHFRGTLPARTVAEASRLPGGALVQVTVVAGR